MLLYISSKSFPFRTFTVRVNSSETIARIRAQLLHILYEIGRENHQFRLRYKGQFLRDSYFIDDYGIVKNSVIKMVPLAKKIQSALDIRNGSTNGSEEDLGIGIQPQVKAALEEEVGVFNRREKLIHHFKSTQYLHFLGWLLSFISAFWWSGFWTGALWIIAVLFCPEFNRYLGYIGGQSIYKVHFCVTYGSGALCQAAISVFLAMYQWTKISDNGCKEFTGDCSDHNVFSALLYVAIAILSLISGLLSWALYLNIKTDYGDIVEKYLVKSRDIEDIMKSAKSGMVKERRQAAFELATMAAAGDDNKFRIVAEGGLETLIRMALTRDEATQEYAAEAIAELILVPAIQENFVGMGGVKTLLALLHSKNAKVMYQACTALSYIISDTEENKIHVATDQGFGDLCHAATVDQPSCQRLVAGIFLDLVFNSDIRLHMASMNSPAQALIKLSQSVDIDCQRLALQTLELLALESSSLICEQEELLNVILQLPSNSADTKLYILAGKLLLYYAENREACERLLDRPTCKNSLFHYARSRDPIVQKVVAKVIYCTLDSPELKAKAKYLELDEILRYLQEKAADREVWDMAEQALQFMGSNEDNITSLPPMTAIEKLRKMQDANQMKEDLGSTTSLRSRASSADSTRKTYR